MYCFSETRVVPLTTIKRERRLPVAGEVLVNKGSPVEPYDIVARAFLPGELRIVEVGKELSLKGQDIGSYLLKEVGHEVKAGEPLAAKRVGLFRRVSRAPLPGVIAAISGGRLLIESTPKPLEITAYLKGQIGQVMTGLGVVVETTGSLIQGAWGMGGEGHGVLKMITEEPTQPLTAEAIDIGCQGAVIVGGYLAGEEALRQAVERQVKGIIVGSISAKLREAAPVMPVPLIVTEGFGHTPMATVIFDLLQSNTGREVCLSATTRPHWDAVRPEVVIPLAGSGQVPPPDETDPSTTESCCALEIGARVRIIRQPHLSQTGQVVALPAMARMVESGARLKGAEIKLDDESDTLFVPLANLDLIR